MSSLWETDLDKNKHEKHKNVCYVCLALVSFPTHIPHVHIEPAKLEETHLFLSVSDRFSYFPVGQAFQCGQRSWKKKGLLESPL